MSRLAKPLERIERLRWLFDNLGLDPQYEEWFRHRAWIRTVHGTTRIEGNSLSDLEVEEVLERTPTLRQKDVLEVLATREALAFADRLARRRELVLDERVIREIHRPGTRRHRSHAPAGRIPSWREPGRGRSGQGHLQHAHLGRCR